MVIKYYLIFKPYSMDAIGLYIGSECAFFGKIAYKVLETKDTDYSWNIIDSRQKYEYYKPGIRNKKIRQILEEKFKE